MRRAISTWATAVGLSLAAAVPQGASGASPDILEPSAAEFEQVIPPEIAARGGRAIVDCQIDASGLLTTCKTLVETPAGRGLGRALESLKPKYRFPPAAAGTDRHALIHWRSYKSDKQPDWRRKPSAKDLMAVWPAEAYAMGLEGGAMLDCLVSQIGSVTDCVVVSEWPKGAGFGAAALAMTPQFTMWPAEKDGKAIVTDVAIPINFRWPDGQPGTRGERPLGVRALVPATQAWAEAPTPEDVMSAYPSKARAEKVTGFAAVSCDFTQDRRLRACTVAREEPRGYGFGAAAKELSRRFRLDQPTIGGKPITEGQVQLRIAFDAETLDAQKPKFGKPALAAAPDLESVVAAQAANGATGVAGRVALDCRIAQGGVLEDCRVVSEDPAGSGLGRTALDLKTHFRLATWSDEGLPLVGRRVQVPLRFDKTPEGAPAAAR